MTGYLVTSGLQHVAVRAVNYELRITQISFWSTSVSASVMSTFRHEGSTLSGGGAVDVAPLYEGAPAASATANAGASLTFSGTNKILGSTIIGRGALTQSIGYVNVVTIQGSSAQIVTPLTLTVAPGSVLHVSGQLSTGIFTKIFFEEIRLPGSY